MKKIIVILCMKLDMLRSPVTSQTGNPTIDACFDSDRLDLWRVGIIPDPDRLATEKGKEIARNTDYESLIGY